MIHHVSLGTNDVRRAREFYDSRAPAALELATASVRRAAHPASQRSGGRMAIGRATSPRCGRYTCVSRSSMR